MFSAIMADANGGSDDVTQFPVPPPLKRPRTCSTSSYLKCIICQVDSSEKLRTVQQSSIVNFISKLQIRQDDVYERLDRELEKLKENSGVLWHSSCYASYISHENLKYGKKGLNEKTRSGKEEKMENDQNHAGRLSRSKVTTNDWSKCLFCKNLIRTKQFVQCTLFPPSKLVLQSWMKRRQKEMTRCFTFFEELTTI